MAELVEAHTEARAHGRVAVRLPVVAAALDHAREEQPLDQVPAALLAHDIAKSASDHLERLLREREALGRQRASSEQVTQHIEGDPPLGIAQARCLRRGQAEVGDSPALHTSENVL
jgi:hypothetical protein